MGSTINAGWGWSRDSWNSKSIGAVDFSGMIWDFLQVKSQICYCHNGDFNNTPNTCIGCHESDYNIAKNPDHLTAMFSTDCTECHTESEWVPSTLDHDGKYFPILTGKHRKGVWNLCTECHIQPSNYAIFSCINCHEHSNKNEVDNDHNEVNGYTYASTACLDCHPNGRN